MTTLLIIVAIAFGVFGVVNLVQTYYKIYLHLRNYNVNREPPERHLCRGCKRTVLPNDGICEDCEQAIQDALDYDRANREAEDMTEAGCRYV